MKKYSGIYKRGGASFRYDYEYCVVERVAKARKEEREDNARWIEKYGRPLWDIDENGYMVIDSVGLRAENWKNKAVRDEYLDEWNMECNFEIEEMVAREFAGAI